MRQSSFILFTCTTLLSYSNNRTAISENNISPIDSLKQRYIPIIKGVWVLTDYINDIEETKSPLKSKHRLDGIVTMVIDVANQSDSIKVHAIWNKYLSKISLNYTAYLLRSSKKMNTFAA